ncbi:acyl carrier protein [Kitasatospora sp. NPDC056181]|uniref:acyl carrier protein n=1 Tax=Kitasatospora sp. NPDC056181 TaxID=3345737 RepID=UPI0035E00D6C
MNAKTDANASTGVNANANADANADANVSTGTPDAPDAARPAPTAEEIRSWLTDRLTHFLDIPAESIDPDVSLAEYGLESVYAFALSGEIEDQLGLAVEPTLIWDVDTVAALTAHLVDLAAAPPAS